MLSTSTASDPLRQAAPSTQPSQDSRLAVFQKEKADLIETLNSHKVALSSSEMALSNETIAGKDMVSALGAFEKRVEHLKTESDPLNEVSHDLMQKKPFRLLEQPQQNA